ncbi:amidohydrolase family protein [Amycolatopsis sp. 195334CR]|uniref:amidohydrolase family protein n=1 Tax=Amycolatopsis sp. 195334CR TaxID=2814588 RepID=UPI001A8C215A|nr:amidohydrolase family protein [Amycolatopsis sp. 195334CR]MBN6037376.1 amidohydrolase family protein [Amycolatopsis sp. 195334CR]
MAESNRRAFLSWLSRSGLVLTAAGVPGLAGVERAAAAEVLVLVNATLIDGTGAAPVPEATIVVAGDRIAAAGRPRVPLPAGVRVLDLRGKYVLPGLWDMHAHTPAPAALPNVEQLVLPAYVANGVTSVREMWGQPHLPELRDRIERGELVGPRMVIASNMVDGPRSFLDPEPVRVSTPAEASAAVRRAKQDGADLVKVYSLLSAEAFAAATAEGRRIGIPVAGHVPELARSDSAAALSMSTQEHLFGLYFDVSSEEERLREVLAKTQFQPDPLTWWAGVRTTLEPEALRYYDPVRAADVFGALAANGVALDATLTGARLWWLPPESFHGDPRTKYLPGWVREDWDAFLGGPWDPARIEAGREFYAATQRLLAEAAGAGVPITAGTDCGIGIPYDFPGFGLHDELALMVEGGVTPMRAIQAATGDAARAAGRERVSGTIAPGKYADLVVLEDDPLTDITNTRRIDAVVSRGRLIDRAARERLLAEIEAVAARTPRPGTSATRCCPGP